MYEGGSCDHKTIGSQSQPAECDDQVFTKHATPVTHVRRTYVTRVCTCGRVRTSSSQVYQIKDPSDEDGPWARGHRSEDFEIDGDLETPLPPPPSPTPAPDTTIAGPRRLRQSWGRSPRGSGAGGSSHSNGDRGDVSIDWRRQDRLEAGTGGGRGGGGGRRRPGKNREEVPVGMFVTPSRLQEASLCSTAVEQAALEQRMREVRRGENRRCFSQRFYREVLHIYEVTIILL